ncbi:MAG: putative motility protein [Halothiobacillaceae bacterium]|nr:MAG: putative motility protein [Halothiobacillaceae bacterium]
MDIGAIASLATDMKAAQTAQAVDVAVLKKALDIQQQTAAQLIQTIPQPNPSANLTHIGQNMDVFA